MALPLLNLKMSRYCLISNTFRNAACNKFIIPLVQPSHGVKSTIEERLGLPEKPKRPISAFFRFLLKIRPSLVQENPNLKFTEIGKLAAQRWENVDQKIKNQLNDEFKQEMEQYMKAKVNYANQLTPKQINDLHEAKLQDLELKEKRILKKKSKDLGRPKKPATTFLRFLRDKRSERGDMSIKEWHKKMSQEWERLGEAYKAKYLEEVQKDKIKYEADLLNWEENMIKLGHLDVIRTGSLLPKALIKK